MCARYEIDAPPEDLAELFQLAQAPALKPRWNAAPTQLLPVVRQEEDGTRRLDLLRWGLVPAWASDLKIGAKTINARAEGIATKPSFRAAFRKRRCLVPVTGFYEWTGEKDARCAFLFRRRDRKPFAFAGLWETWRPPDGGEPVASFSVVTTAANATVAEVHDRMPVIVEPADFATWLDPRNDSPAALERLLVPSRTDLTCFQVGRAVNDARRDDPSCAQPAAAPGLFDPPGRGS